MSDSSHVGFRRDGGAAGQREPAALKIIHRNVYVAADGGTKFRDRAVKIPASRHRKTAECRENPSLEEPAAEEVRVPSPLELPVFPDDLFPGMDCEDVDMMEEVVDLGLDVTSDYDEPREPETKTVVSCLCSSGRRLKPVHALAFDRACVALRSRVAGCCL